RRRRRADGGQRLDGGEARRGCVGNRALRGLRDRRVIPMRAAVSSSLPHVVDAGAVEALVEQITTAATTLQSAMLDAQERWKRIPEVFDVTGAEGAAIMLDPPTASMQDFVTAMFEGRRVLSDAATYILPSLKARREELAARIVTVNQDHADAQAEAQ